MEPNKEFLPLFASTSKKTTLAVLIYTTHFHAVFFEGGPKTPTQNLNKDILSVADSTSRESFVQRELYNEDI